MSSDGAGQRAQRIKKRDALIEQGVDPYGGRFDEVVASADVRVAAEPLNIDPGERSELRTRVAGRIALLRVMGKLAFVTIRDRSGQGVNCGAGHSQRLGLACNRQ